MTRNELIKNIKKKRSFLCVGLDSDIEKLPECLTSYDNPVLEFNKIIIDSTAEYAVAFKPNMAFYESMGAIGWQTLLDTVKYIRTTCPDIFLIADAKRGDIGNTSKLYARAFFKEMDFDAVTVTPYMGEDSVKPFIDNKGKWIIILALTSNKGASDFQFIKSDEKQEYLFERVIKTSVTWGNTENIMYVVGATKAEMLTKIRKIVPDHFLLVPGIGAQGGSLHEVATYGLNKECGLLVNSSRGIILADHSTNFGKTAGIKAREVQREMEELLHKYKVI